MANVPFNALHKHILPYLPGAEPPIVDLQIRKIVREFMKRTTLTRETFQFITVPGVSAYQLTPVFGQVSAVIQAWIDAEMRDLKVTTEEQRPPVNAGKPTGWFTLLPDLINLYPQPDAAYTVTVNAVITLDQAATTLPEELVKHYSEELSAGVLAAMFGMPGKPWTQAQSAKEAGRMYSAAIKTIRGRLRDGGQPNQSTFRGIARFGA